MPPPHPAQINTALITGGSLAALARRQTQHTRMKAFIISSLCRIPCLPTHSNSSLHQNVNLLLCNSPPAPTLHFYFHFILPFTFSKKSKTRSIGGLQPPTATMPNILIQLVLPWMHSQLIGIARRSVCSWGPFFLLPSPRI